MVGTSSTSSSCASLSSLDDVSPKSNSSSNIKFLCSYGGKILPRYPDGKLRYVGGHTRVLSLDRSSTFSELQAKLKELCGWECPFTVRCQLPGDDLDALVSVTSDEDLANLVEEYDLASRDRLTPMKVRAFLLSPTAKPKSPVSPPATKSPFSGTPTVAAQRCNHQVYVQGKRAGNCNHYQQQYHHHHHDQYQYGHASTSRAGGYLVHHGNHWQ